MRSGRPVTRASALVATYVNSTPPSPSSRASTCAHLSAPAGHGNHPALSYRCIHAEQPTDLDRAARAATEPGIERRVPADGGLGGSGVLPSQPGVSQATRAISTARLHVLPRFHLPPINVLVSHGPSGARRPGSAHLEGGFPLRCFQRLSLPDVATRRCPWRNNRYTSGQSIPVLSY